MDGGKMTRRDAIVALGATAAAAAAGGMAMAGDDDKAAVKPLAAGNHTQAVAFGQPLLVLDMYEHAYQMDYGASAAKYVDAFMASVNWDEVERRYERALRAMKALR